MKIVCQKSLLVDAVSNVSRAVSSKSPIPALEGILIKAAGESITLVGYDLEIGIITELEADVKEAGEVVLTARLLLDIIRKIPSETKRTGDVMKVHTFVKKPLKLFASTSIGEVSGQDTYSSSL